MYYKSSYKQLFNCTFKMPFYAIIFRTSKTGAIAENWDAARELRDATTNSYAKKFSTLIDAEKYIKDFNYKIVSKAETNNDYNISLKRKRFESPTSPTNSIKDHLKRIKLAFNNLQVAVASFSELSETYFYQIKNLNEDVSRKLNEIFNIDIIESKEDASLAVNPNTQLLHRSLLLDDSKVLFSTPNIDSTDGIQLSLSELETAKKLFKLNDKNEVIVYTDGACSNNGQNGASAGAGVWFEHFHPLNLSVKVPGIQTNNNAEIFSTIKAIELVKSTGLARISIHTDSDFVIKSINEWMPRWQINGWKTSAGAKVKNKDMFIILDERIKSMDSVSWTYVPGHKGVVGNEEADKLARIGAKM